MTKRVAVLLAPGAEEMETTIIVDVLRRADLQVVLAGVDGAGPVKCSRGIQIVPDVTLELIVPAVERGEFDAIVLPGGAGGADRLAASELVGRVLSRQWHEGRLIGAICAAPLALATHQIAKGADLTSFPSVRPRLSGDYSWHDQRVVKWGSLITSQGPGTTFEFALTLVEHLVGHDVAARVRGPLLLPAN
jgi:protein DJ-1